MNMKKILFFMAAIVLLVSCGNAGKYSITMTLPAGISVGDTIYLTNFDNNDTVASAVVTDSIVKIEGLTDKDFIGVVKLNGRRQISFIVEPGVITVGKDRKAVGTRLNDLRNAFLDSIGLLEQEAECLMKEYGMGKIDSIGFQNTMDSLDVVYVDKFKSVYQANNDNSLGMYAFVHYVQLAELKLAEIEDELASAPIVAQSAYVNRMLDVIRNREKTVEGTMFTDFAVADENGVEQKLSDYVGKGDYVLADFWASWCGPCRAEIPNIKKIYEKYSGKGLTVLGIAVWDAPAATHKAIEELQIPWKQIINAGSVPTDIYGINGIPHIILFAPDGTIVARNLRGDAMIAKVDEVMNDKK